MTAAVEVHVCGPFAEAVGADPKLRAALEDMARAAARLAEALHAQGDKMVAPFTVNVRDGISNAEREA